MIVNHKQVDNKNGGKKEPSNNLEGIHSLK